jgi:Ni/Co efflux regulator RcnB
MKKTMMFILAAVMVVPAMAQTVPAPPQDTEYGIGREGGFKDGRGGDFDRDRDISRHGGDYDSRNKDAYYFSKTERDQQVSQINREYDYKVRNVQYNYFMSRHKKERIVCRLEEQRQEEIKQVYAKFFDRRNRFEEKRRRWNS